MKCSKSVLSFTAASLCAVSLFTSGCSSSDGGVNLNSLSSIPSTSQLVGANDSTTTALKRYALGFNATGTPPLMSAVTTSSAADQYFWNGLVAYIKDGGDIDEDIQSRFYGSVDTGPGGMGACQMVQSVGQAMEQITGNSNTLCYMKRIPTVATITPQGSNAAVSGDEVFAQQAEDRWVKVEVRNMQQGEETVGQDVFIRVMGSNNLTGNKYQVKLHFCQESTVTGYEDILVDRDSAELSATSASQREGDGAGTSTVTAFLTEQDGVFIIDPSKSREGVSQSTRDWGGFKGKILVDADGTVNAWAWNQGDSFSDKSFVRASTSGASYAELRFLDGAYKGISGGDGYSHEYSGATTFDTDHYKATTSGDLYTYIQSYSLTGDSFFSGSLDDVTVDLSGYSCDQTADYVIDMDFAANSALADIQDECETDRMNYQMCWSGDVAEAQQLLWQP